MMKNYILMDRASWHMQRRKMKTLCICIFVVSIFGFFHAYFGYPLSLLILRVFRNKKTAKKEITPRVSFIIAAHNEETRINKKLENTIGLDYPSDKFQIIVASDGSTDRTDSLISEFAPKGVLLHSIGERKGKENAQKEAVDLATGEILVFSDVATFLKPDAVRHIVANFADPAIGCVSSEDKMIEDEDNGGGEGLYVKYEMWIRRLESSVNSVVGLSGSFFAARKEVFRDFATDMDSDFRTLLNSMKIGLRGVVDPAAIGYYSSVKNPSQEFTRKVRTVLRGLTVFFGNLDFLNPFHFGLFSYQYFCHKLMKWLVPFFLAGALLSNCVLAVSESVFACMLALQGFFYLLSIAGLDKKLATRFIFRIPAFFVMVNLSIFIAWMKFIKGERLIVWQPSARN
jgi:glycosyltransferase involved in cell wall biosynthesis